MGRSTRFVALGSACALAAATFALTAAPGSAQETPELEKIALANEYLVIDTSTDTVTYGGLPEESQSIIEGCSLDDVLTEGPLLSVSPGSGRDKLGFGKNGIGVSGKKDKNGTKCADVDFEFGQSLVVSLGSAVGVAVRADLDLEFKFGGDVEVKAFVGGIDGESVDVDTNGGPSDASDNGPDSGDGDNYRVMVESATATDAFDTLVLTATSGSFSLEGGGDGTVESDLLPGTSGSVFEVVVADGPLLCEENDPDGVTEDDVNVVFTDCEPGERVPYLLDRITEQVDADTTRDRVLLSVPESATNSYIVTIPWASEPAVLPLPRTEAAFFQEVDGPFVYDVDLEWCGGSEEDPVLEEDIDSLTEGNQGACLISQTATIGPSTGLIEVTDKILLVGDPAFGRLR